MRLARKLSILLIIGVFIIVAAFGYVRLEREASLFRTDIRRDHRIMALTLSVSAEQALMERGEQGVDSLIRRVDASRHGVSVRWLPRSPAHGGHRAWSTWSGNASESVFQQVAEPLPTAKLAGGGEHLFSYATVTLDGVPQGTIELVESLAPERDYVRRSLWMTVLSSLSLVAMCGLVAVAVGVRLVGRPVNQLIAKARRTGRGDFGGPLNLRQDDELGALGRELNSMCEQLDSAQQGLLRETQARVRTAEQLRHADRLTTVGRLVSAIAHELGTPLNVVAGHAKLVTKGTLQPEQVRHSANVIREQCERMARIVRQVLDYARRSEPEISPSDVGALVSRAAELLEPLAQKQGVALNCSISDTPSALVDPTQLQQAVTNLLVNAIQASDRGGNVSVRVSPITPEELCALGVESAINSGSGVSWVGVSVEDEGGGMEDAVVRRLFEPFFTTKPTGEGTGLGLSIAREIVERLGGKIFVSTELGRGSCFRICLPTSQAAGPA